MIVRICLIFAIFVTFAVSSPNDIKKQIKNNKKAYLNAKIKRKSLNKNIHTLASKIMQEEKRYKQKNNTLNKINTKLILNKLKLSKSLQQLEVLKKQSIDLRENKSKIESDVVDFVIKKYSMSLGLKQTNKKTLQDIVDKEVYTLIFENAQAEVLNLNVDYLKVNSSIRQNITTTNNLNLYIKEQSNTREKYIKINQEQEKAIKSLKLKHQLYSNNLVKTVKKQNQLTDILGDLNILQKKEIKKARLKAKKEQDKLNKIALAKKKAKAKAKAKKQKQKAETKKQKVKELESREVRVSAAKDINIKVRNLGSSAKGIKILKYKGKKTIAPLRSYKITKKFGKYYDAVYNMKLFNESVSLKTKKANAKVLSVFKGEIVYAKQNSGLLEKVVIVKHRNGLHTIYSHLDKISPTIKVGKWIPKGYVVGRINDTLLFQATKNGKYIDPTKLFK